MKLAIYTLLIYVLLPLSAYSQTFSGLYDCDSSFDWGWDVFQKNDSSYFVVAGAQKDYDALAVMNVSSDGIYKIKQGRYPVGMSGYTGDPGQAQHLANGGYIIPITLQTLNRSFGGIAKLDESGDTVFLKTYTDTTLFFDVVTTCTEMPNGDYLIGGSREANTPSDYPGQVIRTDSNGNIKWRRTFQKDPSEWTSVNTICPIGQNRILVGAMSTYPFYTPQGILVHNTPWFIVLDSVGNMWHDTAYGGNYGGGGTIYRDANGGYIHLGSIDSMPNPDPEAVENFPGYIAHIDTNFHIEWILRFNYTPDLGKAYWSIARQLSDGDFLLAGDVYADEYGGSMGWLAKVSSTGNLLWSRQYVFDIHHFNYFRDVQEKSDKGFIITGASFSDSMPNWHQHQDVWLVSLDSNGCIVPGCNEGLVVKATNKDDMQIKLYPNPTHGEFILETSSSGHFYLYTILGQLISHRTILRQSTTISIPDKMPQGQYFGRFESDKGNQESTFPILYEKE